MMKTLVFVLLLISATAAMHPPSQRTNRLPLQKKHIVLQAPKNYAQRFLGMDRDTGKEIYYDPKPEVVLLDEKGGKYAFKWIGYDGKEKTVIYQRPDAINAVVSARVETTGSGNSTYTYTIENLQSSGEELTSYFVQNFAAEVRPAKAADMWDQYQETIQWCSGCDSFRHERLSAHRGSHWWARAKCKQNYKWQNDALDLERDSI